MLLAAAVAVGLPLIVKHAEEDNLLTQGGRDAVDGGLLVGHGGNVVTNGVTGGREATLENETLLSAGVLHDGELGLDKRASFLGGGVVVKVSVNVGGHIVNNIAYLRLHIALLPRRNNVRGCPGASVVRELALDVVDEILELAGCAVAVVVGLVGDGKQINKIPATPGLVGGDLLLNIRASVVAPSLADEDADNHLEAVLLTGSADIGQGITVGRVHAQRVEACLRNCLHICVNSVCSLTLASIGIVRRVSERPRVSAFGVEVGGAA